MKKVLLLLLLLLLPAFSAETPKSLAKPAPKNTLLFFINPNGRPCQMQLQILQDGMKDLEKVAKLQLIKTTEPNDRQAFYQYGIRSLPSLILVDAQGKEKLRFAPGIQEMSYILQQIYTVK